ncbi:MAG: hypothetical protein MK211_02745 [Flavobacteriales bacterium]|jgi:hypothetical protein|uniref:hypothetical protein n=1 Tax=Candidatus Ulvibacter alkanivorans TaxID=2267620 RepID=UPI000DF236F8|nr:hypothetical protein [Candidatus Ulvibacter alkanivorans]MCH2489047.1 hypothetical protein [Flavobacteriales bacterium]
MKTKETRKKKHADFQDSYRRSSNFGKAIKNEDFAVTGNGKLKLTDEERKARMNVADFSLSEEEE